MVARGGNNVQKMEATYHKQRRIRRDGRISGDVVIKELNTNHARNQHGSVCGVYLPRHPPSPDLIALRVGNFRQKIIPRKTELTEQMPISDGIPAVLRNRISRNSVLNPSAEEKTSRGTDIEANSRNSLTKPSAEEKKLGIPFRGTEIEANSRNSLPNLSAEEKTTRNSVPNHSAEEKTTQNKTRQRPSPTVPKLKVLVETVRIGFYHPG